MPIFSKSSCDAKNLVYIICCSFCNSYYIGQTQSLKERISSHKSKIKNFILFSDQFDAISTHFNLKFHSLDHHFSFYVLQSEPIESFERLNMEIFFININLFKNIKINLIMHDVMRHF